ncbi:NAD-dependent DNA ligase LigA [Halobacteriovorax sp. GB3]|uniref:NAD-dependent DNA ligase LigA n=1 Tax=Halobacteriovorax sp. GB3 TaxID=2719615 RepID=UPI0023620575|nr:NAD-dependent DNA ligase LigA [Halobacteriovorax sp. GB3]MDD0854751.1 NAD-dependent DNA ligase LigA [Halobacteriovorax sp. GB3]
MNRIVELEKQIRHHKALYYQGRPEISDFDYDRLEDELKELAPNNPILRMVGSQISSEDKVKHDKKMLSLGKTYDPSELLTWKAEYPVVSMFKIDGISCSLIYEDGELVIAKTRGDGTFGENITSKVMWLPEVPKKISIQERVEVRGELFCTEEEFFHLSEEMEKIGLDKPTSQRNIVAGLMGRKDRLELCRYLKFKGFDVLTDAIDFNFEMDKYHWLKKENFDVLEIELHEKTQEIKKVIEDARVFMSEGDFQIDGLVFAYNDLKLQEELGETAHHPRYKMAFKFQGEAKTTVLKDILWNVSRNGILTPVGIVKPVELSGAKISRVTLHNYGMVKQHDLKKGDTIEIIRSGEVIPKFMSVISRGDGVFERPEQCPSCDQKVYIEDIRLVCRNEYCPSIVKESILNYIQKIGIDDISGKRLEEMIKMDLVKSIEDLYKLKEEDFLKLEKVKEKLANKFFVGINASKKANLIKFLSALGITGGAINKCEKVVHAGFDSIDKILSMSVEQLEQLDGFAEKSATEFVKSIQAKKELITNLRELGVEMKHEVEDLGEQKLEGLHFVITGTLSEKRSIIEKRIKESGGKTGSSVTSNTNYLVCNDKESTSSKAKKARELGIPLISEEELKGMI